MAVIKIRCPYCGSEDIIAFGKTKNGTQRYRCKNEHCSHISFLLTYKNKASQPGVSEMIVDMAMNGCGTRDTARVLGISKDTVTRHLRMLANSVQTINTDFLNNISDSSIDVLITNPMNDQNEGESNGSSDAKKVGAGGLGVEMDEQWSWCGNKHQQVWLWWAVDHETNTPLAFTFGTHEHQYLDVLMGMLVGFNINVYYTDNHFAYRARINENRLRIGKRNTQKIERNHLTLRTRIKRLARKTICFSKMQDIHEAVIGTFINRYLFRQVMAT